MDRNRERVMIPCSGGPKRLAFRIRKFRNYGSTSLLIANRLGVWSAVRCRHVRETRYLRFLKLKADAVELERCYVRLRNLGGAGANDDERVASCRRRLADFYWDAAPASYRAEAVEYFRVARRKKQLLLMELCLVAFLQAATFVRQARLWATGRFLDFCILLLPAVALHKIGANMYDEVSRYNDVVVTRLLKRLARKRDY